MSSAKTFAIYALAALSGLLLFGGLKGLSNPAPASVSGDAVSFWAYWSTTAALIAIGAGGLTWSLKWIRRQKKSQ